MKHKVLIVDDIEDMRSMLELVVNEMPGFAVSGMAGNTFEARLEIARRRPDVVLLDEILPGESSGDLLAELAAEKIPVVLITGMEEASAEIPPGASARVCKPDWDTLDDDRERIARELERALGGR